MEEETQTPLAETPAAVAAKTPDPAPAALPAATVAEVVAETAPAQAVPSAAEGESACPLGVCEPWMLAVFVIVLAALGVLFTAIRRRRAAPGKGGNGSVPAKANGDVVEIYVGNLSYDMTEEQFRKTFERFGVVKSARIIGHRTSGKSKGYGFIEMPHRKEAAVAIKALHNKEVMGRKLRVNEARNGTVPKE